MDLDLTGKVAVVTGGSRGIGRAVGLRLAAEGCDVMLAARTQVDLETAAEEIRRETGRRVDICPGDLRSPEGCDTLVARQGKVFGGLDILVNNAGATQAGNFLDLEDDVWEDGFALKFYSYLRLCRGFWPLLVSSQGAVVNVIGAASKTPNPTFMIGGAVNAAVTNFTKALAGLGLEDNVVVNAVHPGPVVTERLNALLDQRAAALGMSREEAERRSRKAQGVRAYSQPEDVAALVAYLASPVARQIHGADVFVDGGLTKAL